MILDKEGRVIDYIRISVTDRCNLRCVYCMPEEGIKSIGHDRILSYEEILRICRILAEHGLKTIKITGGEPLVRKDVVSLIRELKKINGIENVSITTNGVLLAAYYDQLAESKVDAITVSLDTLNPAIYKQITRRNELSGVLAGIEKAIADGRVPLKINCVPFGLADKMDVLALLDFARNADIDVRFIEMMPIGLGKHYEYISEGKIREIIEAEYGPLTLFSGKRGNGPSKYYDIPGFIGKVGFISAVSHKFCDSCNRVRLTSDGFLKTCLHYNCGADLHPLLIKNASDQMLWQAMKEAIYQKPKSHHFDGISSQQEIETRGMSQIGG